MDDLERLNGILKGMKSAVVAYSGGLDSSFLLKAAIEVLGRKNVLAVTARSETYPQIEYRQAKRLADDIGARHLTIKTSELAIKNFADNPVDRCYYCKKELFGRIDDVRRTRRMAFILDGTNRDDLKDIRHGARAARELGVRSPLLEAGIGKEEIRKYSKRMELPTWDKPSFACLASRFPFRTRITKKDLERIDKAESYLRGVSGLKQVRVRLHGDIARIELYESDFRKLMNAKIRKGIVRRLKSLGFRYITLDVEGYRTGSMHETVIDKK